MRRLCPAWLFSAICLLVLLQLMPGVALASPAPTERRVALVVGMGQYENATRLLNPPKDAAAMADALRSLDFDVLEAIDLNREKLVSRLKEFGRRAAGADLALVFYAGHGVQVENENWLLPTDVKLSDKMDLEYEAINATALLRAMEDARGRILILDACRDNPFREGFMAHAASRSMTRGLAPLEATDTGTLVAFATSPGAVADDGSSDGEANSPFTRALLSNIRTPGLEIRQMLTRARQAVITSTRGRQTPWENSSLLSDIYLAGQARPQPVPEPAETKSDAAPIDMPKLPDFTVTLQRPAKTQVAAMTPPPALGSDVAKPVVPAQPIRDCPTCPEVIQIPAGSFIMGATTSDSSAAASERPAHRADVPAFGMTRYPVTFDQWQACLDDGGCTMTPSDSGWGRGKRPVINVSWDDAQSYVAWLSRKTGVTYRLPTETEWEYAARAGTTSTRFWGEDPGKACGFANVYDQGATKQLKLRWGPHACSDGFTYTSPVGSFAPNPWGLADMIGNVWQWTADCWTDDYSTATGVATAVSFANCTDHVLRGGSWMSDAAGARSSARMRSDASDKDINIGFRLVRVAH